MGAKMIADVLPAALVTDVHFVPASCAPNNAVQQKIAVAGSSSRLGTHIFGSIVSDNTANFFIDRPVDVRRIPILHDDPPFLDRPLGFSRRTNSRRRRPRAGPSENQPASVGGLWADRR